MNDNVKTENASYEAKYPPNEKPQLKKRPKFTVFDFFTFPICFTLLYIFFDSLFSNPDLRTTVSYWGLFILATCSIAAKTKSIPLKAVFPGLICLLSSLSFSIRLMDDMIQAGVIMLLILFSGIYCICLTNSNVHSFGSIYVLLDIIRCEFLLPIAHIFTPASSLAHSGLRKSRKERKTGRKRIIIPVIFGVLAGLLVLAFVLPLLLDSDLVFEAMLGKISDKLGEYFSYVFDWFFGLIDLDAFSVILTLIFCPFVYAVIFSFGSGITSEENKDTSAKYRKLQKLPVAFFAAALGVVSVIYVIYIISQSTYLFSAFSGHLPFGLKISVTEYARRGFFEMLKIACANFALIFVAVGFCRRNSNRISSVIKGFSVFLCAFNIFICAVSISKILLYINTFGMTEKRLLVFAADIVLIITFIVIIVRFFVSKLPYMQIILCALCLSVTVLSLMGVNATVARYNANAVISGKTAKINLYQMFDDCGVSSLPYIEKITASDSVKASDAKDLLDKIYNDSYIGPGGPVCIENCRFTRWFISRSEKNDTLKFTVNLDKPDKIESADFTLVFGDKEYENHLNVNKGQLKAVFTRDMLPDAEDGDKYSVKLKLIYSSGEEYMVDMSDCEDLICLFGRTVRFDAAYFDGIFTHEYQCYTPYYSSDYYFNIM